MSQESNKTPEMEQTLEEVGMRLFGRSRSLAAAGNQCIECGNLATEFKDELSKKEYGISKLCQTCQDGIFGTGEEHVDTYNEENLT